MHCWECSETTYIPVTVSLYCLLTSLPALRLPFPSSLPLSSPSLLPGWLLSLLRRLRNASRCFLYMTQPHTHTLLHTVSWTHFLSCAHKRHETHIVLTSGGNLYLTFALRSLCREQIQEELPSHSTFYAFHKD